MRLFLTLAACSATAIVTVAVTLLRCSKEAPALLPSPAHADPATPIETVQRVAVEDHAERVPVDTASVEAVADLEAQLADRDERIAELEAQLAQLRSASLATQFVGALDGDGEPIEAWHIDGLLSEIAEGDKFATLPDVEAMLRSTGAQNTLRILEAADVLTRTLVQKRNEHRHDATDAEHRAWMQHTWPSVVADEIRLATDDLHRFGAPGYVVEALRQKAQELFLR